MSRKTIVRMTEAQWGEVFHLRCKSKREGGLTLGELSLCERARGEDHGRYAAMEADVFDATVPFGSSARARR